MSHILKDQPTPNHPSTHQPFINRTPQTSHLHLPLRQGYNNNDTNRSMDINSPLEFLLGIPLCDLKIGEYIGHGSYGTVRKGTWHRSRNKQIDVAIKLFQSDEERESFLIEVRQLSCVKHPNIVKLYGASTENKPAYLVMEYAEGGSLYHLLHNHDCRQQQYDLRHACSWAMQTARGVAYLHSMKPKPIMHRDLKPANLLLFSRGKILKICDFGTACAVKTQMTNNTGSACYMAPEVMRLSSYQEKGDVFSWAIIFWEILARRTPHPRLENVYQVMWKVCEGGRPPRLKDCPEIIEDLICKSWDMNPNIRPSMEEVVKKIELIHRFTTPLDNEFPQAKANSTPSLDSCSLTSKVPIEDKAHLHHLVPDSQQQHSDGSPYNQHDFVHSLAFNVANFGINHVHSTQPPPISCNEGSTRQSQLSMALKADQRYRSLAHHLNLLNERRLELEKMSRKKIEQESFNEYKWLKEMTKFKKKEIDQQQQRQSSEKRE